MAHLVIRKNKKRHHAEKKKLSVNITVSENIWQNTVTDGCKHRVPLCETIYNKAQAMLC